MSDKNPESTAPAGRSPRKWAKVLLAVSLTMNLLVVGMVGGVYLRDGSDQRALGARPERAAMRDLGFGPFVNALPHEYRRGLARAMRDQAGSFAENQQALVAELRMMLSAIRSEPFEMDVLRDAMRAQQDRVNMRAQVGRDLLLAHISQLSESERNAFADQVERSLRRAVEAATR